MMELGLFLIKVVFAVLGIAGAFGFGLWLRKRTSFEITLLASILVGRILLLITDAIVEVITKL